MINGVTIAVIASAKDAPKAPSRKRSAFVELTRMLDIEVGGYAKYEIDDAKTAKIFRINFLRAAQHRNRKFTTRLNPGAVEVWRVQ